MRCCCSSSRLGLLLLLMRCLLLFLFRVIVAVIVSVCVVPFGMCPMFHIPVVCCMFLLMGCWWCMLILLVGWSVICTPVALSGPLLVVVMVYVTVCYCLGVCCLCLVYLYVCVGWYDYTVALCFVVVWCVVLVYVC